MFTGLVEELGTVRALTRQGRSAVLEVGAGLVLEDTRIGDSIAINGACQTVTEQGAGWFRVDSLAATLEKTTLGRLRPGQRVNLERSVTPSTRMGGHFVQGHVDGTGQVLQIREDGRNIFFRLRVPKDLTRYLIREGSIAIDGVSLTIAELEGEEIEINVIPATWSATCLVDRGAGDPVNLEVDVLARYVERMLPGASASELTFERLRALGY